ncbi:MAG: precorrin-2 C(20)-methyltransferase [Bacteroidia bacterium]|nr:MAG: precorrin-2 C(20)-methyltransferase [Bacteroidia bacterium]
MRKGKLYGVGVGPGDPDLLTLKAVKVLEKADLIFVPKSTEQQSTVLKIVAEYLPQDIEIESLDFSMSPATATRIQSRKRNAKRINEALNAGKCLVFLTLGDPMLYSTYSYILEYIDRQHVETIPGIYSFAAISSLLSFPLCKGKENLVVVSSFDTKAQELILKTETSVLMKISLYHKELYTFLKNNEDYDFVMVTEVGKEKQKISYSIEDLKEKIPYFSTAIIKKQIG